MPLKFKKDSLKEIRRQYLDAIRLMEEKYGKITSRRREEIVNRMLEKTFVLTRIAVLKDIFRKTHIAESLPPLEFITTSKFQSIGGKSDYAIFKRIKQAYGFLRSRELVEGRRHVYSGNIYIKKGLEFYSTPFHEALHFLGKNDETEVSALQRFYENIIVDHPLKRSYQSPYYREEARKYKGVGIYRRGRIIGNAASILATKFRNPRAGIEYLNNVFERGHSPLKSFEIIRKNRELFERSIGKQI